MTREEFNNRLVLKFLRAFLKMGVIIYPVFVVVDAFGGHAFRWISVGVFVCQIAVFLWMIRLLNSRQIAEARAHQHAFGMACLVLMNCAFRVEVMGDPNLVFYIQELLILCGMVMLDYRWFGLAASLCFSVWALGSTNNLPPETLTHQALMVALFGLLSFTCLVIRIRVFEIQFELHKNEEETQKRLAGAIEEAGRLTDELDLRVHAGSEDIAKTVDELKLTLKEQEFLHQQLLHSQRIEAMGRLAGGVAHEFSNALTIILAHLSELRTNLESNEVLDEIEAAAGRGRDLIGRLVSLTGHRTLRRESMTVGTLFEDQIQPLSRSLPSGVQCRLVNDSPDLLVRVDSGAMYQVFQNLIQNSVQALQGEGEIEVRISPHADKVRIDFRDTGPGLTAEAQELMFEPFFTTKAMGEGTGLGLAIAKGVVEGHEGSLRLVETNSEGTTFRVELPRCTLPVECPTVSTPCLKSAQGEKILLVEDEATILTLATRYLNRKGFSVLPASDGQEALKILKREPDIDLVVTDVVMPRLGGADLASLQLSDATSPPFLFISGYPDDRLQRMGLEKKNVNFLAKPYQLSELGTKVASLLS